MRQQFMRGGIYSADSRDVVFRRHRTPLYAGLHHCTGTVPAAHNSRDFRRCGNTSCGAVRRNPDTAPSSHNLAPHLQPQSRLVTAPHPAATETVCDSTTVPERCPLYTPAGLHRYFIIQKNKKTLFQYGNVCYTRLS